MTEVSSKTAMETGRSTRQALLTLVREACDMLVSAHPTVVGSTTVSRTLDDGGAVALVRTMALRLAEEYGVDAKVTTNGSAISIRLTRDEHPIHLRRPRPLKGTYVWRWR